MTNNLNQTFLNAIQQSNIQHSTFIIHKHNQPTTHNSKPKKPSYDFFRSKIFNFLALADGANPKSRAAGYAEETAAWMLGAKKFNSFYRKRSSD
jgi:hypothetical protein